MTALRINYLYRETTQWQQSVAWWENLGFTFETRWGEEPHRAGRLTNDATSVVLAEVALGDVSSSIFLSTDDIASISRQSGSPIVDTHWGTRVVTVSDPDGRTYNFEPGGNES
jgi:uncharacterized glyoxalase superfamily protein PhnB